MTVGVDLTVYGREDCHLCHDMIAALEEFQPEYQFTFEVVDVDEDETLERQYGHLVPVLTGNGEEICHYFLDLVALAAYFGKIR
jgi:glutaredoxin